MEKLTLTEMFTNLGSAIAGLMFAWAMFQQYFPHQLRGYLDRYTQKLVTLVYPYIQITFHEHSGRRLKQTEVYANIRNYLSANSSTCAKRLKADAVNDSQSVVLTMDDYEEITDEYNGIKIWWASSKRIPKTQSFSFYPDADEKRFFRLTVHRRYRDLITNSYIDHVIKEGKSIAIKNRQRKLYTNNPSKDWREWIPTKWSHVVFEHPASFDTLGMADKKKREIVNDLIKFSKGKEYYAKVGKAWKRGYLLHGPPGTGKSTMIAAMANLLNYDIYDLELTTVKDNSELRRLLIDTTGKSIIIIEDIDCSLDLTGQRKPKAKDGVDEDAKESQDPISEKKKKDEEESKNASKVTLSGLLNFIDGIWSACGGERIIVFTTNYVEKLDPALIRRGRMDKHIEMSYCCVEAFRVLARNYLDIEHHEMFSRVGELLEEIKMTPADVAENLMPKSDEEDADSCLKNLIAALEETKEEEARKKTEEEEEEKAKLKAEKEAKEKEKAEKEDEKENGKIDEEIKENGFISDGNKKSSD